MGKFSRDKGARVERNIVHQLSGAGIIAERVPLSGSMGGSFTKDISVEVMGKRKAFEVKARADGFKEIYKWLKGAAGLFLKADRQHTLVVLRFDDWAELVRMAGAEPLNFGGFIIGREALSKMGKPVDVPQFIPANDNEDKAA